MEYLQKEDFIIINQRTVKRHGGNFVPPFNFLKEDSLDYLIDAVEAEMFGQPLYPSIADKAGFLMYSIIANHVFQDGNKRTGLEAALLFLKLNGYQLKEDLKKVKFSLGGISFVLIPEKGNTSNEILFEFTLSVAKGNTNVEICKLWFSENIEKRK